MKILLIIAQSKLESGGAIQMARLARELKNAGHDVTTVFGENSQIPETHFSEITEAGIRLKTTPLPKLQFSFNTLRHILQLRKLLKEEHFDIIHAHKGTATDYVFFATLGMDVPIVANRGVTNPLDFFNALKYKTNKIKAIVAVSESVKEVMVKTGGIRPDKIEVVYGSVDTNKFSPNVKGVLRKELRISADTFVWGFLGNAGKRKGLPYLLKAFVKYHERYGDDVLLLVGVPPDVEPLKPYHDLLPKSIFAVGFRKDTPQCLADFDAFVFTGIFEEGLTGTVREAGAMQLPIVCSDVAGNRELIIDRETGLLVPKEDSDATARAMLELREDKALADKLARNVRAFVKKNMSNEIRGRKLVELYRRFVRE